MSLYRRFEDLDCSGKRVLLRAGFDVPIEKGVVVDTTRITALLPTMRAILDAGASLVILAHQGRPKGKPVPEESQRPLASVVQKLLGLKNIKFAPSCTGEATEAMAKALQPGDVLLLENLRYDAREEANDSAFAAELAKLGDVYVDDAFSNAHRAHASMVSLPKLIPSAMGLQMQREVDNLCTVRDASEGLCVIVSGAKLETKVPVIRAFLGRSQSIVVGGAIANTFLAASGKKIGVSLAEDDAGAVATAKTILAEAEGKILLPIDSVVAPSIEQSSAAHVCTVDDIPPAEGIFDVGPASTAAIEQVIARAKVIVWNGPLGVAEQKPFSRSTIAVAHAIAKATSAGAFTVIGGGDTLEAHERYGLPLDAYSFVSTGGGAMLDFLAGDALPALEALRSA